MKRMHEFCSRRGTSFQANTLSLLVLLLIVTIGPVQAGAQTYVPLSDVVQIGAGANHTCAVTAAGGVMCWGANYGGQLGDGTFLNSYTATQVAGLEAGVVLVSSGGVGGFYYYLDAASGDGAHSCVLTALGAARCWGDNVFGQLGNGTTGGSNIPLDVSGLSSGVLAVQAGGGHSFINASAHSCALSSGGAVKCWGHNGFGQLGDDSTSHRSVPVDVIGLPTGIQSVALGGSHSCAITAAGGVKCWGKNTRGQLGDSTLADRYTPVDVVGLASGTVAVSLGGEHGCAITSVGRVKCWGSNFHGQVGDNTTSTRLTPVDVSGLVGATAIAAGGSHTCAIDGNGAVKCWGNNSYGQLGDNTTFSRLTPTQVANLPEGAVSVAVGTEHSCALTSARLVKCWGRNVNGELGDNSAVRRLVPATVLMQSQVVFSDGFEPH
jgi:alpha-tubulin suppressor-like RCC1 family protein